MSSLEHFQCRRCGKCCRWPGPVRVSDSEIDVIADFLGMTTELFIRDLTVLCPDRRGLSLTERPDGACYFYDDSARCCRIQSVKPAQCRNFPFLWNFKGWETICEGGIALARAEKSTSSVS